MAERYPFLSRCRRSIPEEKDVNTHQNQIYQGEAYRRRTQDFKMQGANPGVFFEKGAERSSPPQVERQKTTSVRNCSINYIS